MLCAVRAWVALFELGMPVGELRMAAVCVQVGGADMIKLGYVSRQHIRDNFHHALLGTQVGPAAIKKRSCA